MLLQELRDRVKRYFTPATPRTPEQNRSAAADARRDRADVVADLHNDVHRLQHEIAALGPSPEGAAAGEAPTADAGRLSALQAELVRVQRELARFQGRI